MMRKILLPLYLGLQLLWLCCPDSLSAQETSRGRCPVGPWYKKACIEYETFVLKELQLTDDETRAFLPLMRVYDRRRVDCMRSALRLRREIETKVNPTDREIDDLLDQLYEAKLSSIEIQKEYYDKLKGVIPRQKILKLSRLSRKFVSTKLMSDDH
ncbi:hypothetical protein [Porphyromonas crevioricanis]|nr:hypothetical protein [Porphyromonas crevioricanis]